MLYALRDPLSFVVLVLSFVVASTLAGWVGTRVAVRSGTRELDDRRRLRPDPRAHLDPLGAVAAALTGVGWHRPAPMPTSRRAVPAATLVGPLVLLLVAAVLLVGAGATAGRFDGADATILQNGLGGPLLPRVLLLAGLVHLSVGLLALVPLPPLEVGRLLFARAPRTPGWQKAELYLVEKNLGTAAVLVLLLLPLGGRLPLLLSLLSAVGRPLVALLTGLLPGPA